MHRVLALLTLFAMAWSGLCSADDSPSKPGWLRHADDYTFGFYPLGWKRAKAQLPIRYAVQTNRYAASLDAERARLDRLGPIASPLNAEKAVAQGDALAKLPKTELSFAVLYNGQPFPVTAGALHAEQLQIYESGRFLQHFGIQTVEVGGRVAAGLEGAHAWMDGYCWPDRIALELHVAVGDDHLAPVRKFDKVALAAYLDIPAEYPIVEALGENNAWSPATSETRSERGMLVRNEQGEGIALLCTPGAGQHLRVDEKHRLVLATDEGSMVEHPVRACPCIAVPSLDVRADAVREWNAMQASEVRIEAVGIAPYTQALGVDYSPAKGWNRVALGESPDPNTLERVRVKLTNPTTEPRTVRLNLAKTGGQFSVTGMSPVLRDATGLPTGLPVQISKNWHCVPTWFSGLTMVELAPKQELSLEFDLAYARWGTVPAVSHAQLCLAGYGGNQVWDQMAIGSNGESICYDPDVGLNRSLVDDMRPLMVWGMGDTPKIKWSWTHNVGGSDFLVLFRKDMKDRQYLARQKTLYWSYGPVLTDVTYAGQTPEGAIQSRVRTQSWRSDDYVRALYTLRYDVVAPLDDIDRLAFFQLGADRYNSITFNTLARGNLDGQQEAWKPEIGGHTYSRRSEPMPGSMPGSMPWIGTFDVTHAEGMKDDDKGAVGDKALIVRSWKARLNGQDCPVPHFSIYGTGDGANQSALVELSPPPDTKQVQPGDWVEAQVEVLILPQKADDYYGPNANLAAALAARKDASALALREVRGSALEVAAKAGTVEQAFPVRIQAKEGREADFVITGGVGYTPATISGASASGPFVLEQVDDQGRATAIDESSAVGNDWWQADYRPATGTWDLTFTINLDTPNDARAAHHIRWRLK